MKKHRVKPNIKTELMGKAALITSFACENTSSRMHMAGNQMSQTCTPNKPEIPLVLTGFEQQLSDFTYSVNMPTDGRVLEVIPKYYGSTVNSSRFANPSLLILYQCLETNNYDVIELKRYDTKHRVYGSRYKFTPVVKNLMRGMVVPKGTLLAHTETLIDERYFSNSVRANVALLSLPGTIEDGYIASKSFCMRAGLTKLETVTESFGKSRYILNLYGDDNNYQPFPNIGDEVAANGILVAFRNYNGNLDAGNMTNSQLRKITSTDDTIMCTPGAIVYDIEIFSGIGESTVKPITPPVMSNQCQYYLNELTRFYKTIVNFYLDTKKISKNPTFSPRLNQLIVRALADKPAEWGQKQSGIIRRTIREIPLDEWVVRIRTVSPVSEATLGTKVSGSHGDKGVITVKVVNDEDMPTDANGVRAEMVKYCKSPISRLDPGQCYEQYFGAWNRDFRSFIIKNRGRFSDDHFWNILLTYYKLISPQCYKAVAGYGQVEIKSHIDNIVHDAMYIIVPADSEIHERITEIVTETRKLFEPTYSRLLYRNHSGKLVYTKCKTFIGVQQFLILEKSDLKPMSISSSPMQHHGAIAGASKHNTSNKPSKRQATRVISETEGRSIAAVMGPLALCEMLDMSNNNGSHRDVVKMLIENGYSSGTDSPVNRVEIPLGNSRPLLFAQSILLGLGTSLDSIEL